MQDEALQLAREKGALGHAIRNDMLSLLRQKPGLLTDDAALAAALRGKGYTDGEVEAHVMLGGRLS